MVRTILARCGLVASGVLIVAVLTEGALRTLPGAFPGRIQGIVKDGWLRATLDSTRAPDGYLGVKLKPGLDVVITDHPDYRYRIKTYLNHLEAGFRGNIRERPVIGVALGDSFTFGVGVDAEEAWPEILSRLSSGNFVNLGVPGYGPPQYTRTLLKYGLSLQPRMVLYAFTQNDVGDSECFANWLATRGKFACPPGQRQPSAIERLGARHLSIYWLIKKLGSGGRETRGVAPYDSPDGRLHLIFDVDSIVHRAKGPQSLASSTIGPISEAYRIVEAASAKFILLLIPSKEQVYWHIVKKNVGWLDGYDLDALNRALTQFCRQHAIPYIDLTPSFREEAKQNEQLYFRLDGHWNPDGHRLAAQRIFEYLKKEKLL